MAKVELTPEELELLTQCVNEQKDVPAELLTKLSPVFFEKLAADGRFDFKALDKFKIPTIEYAGKRAESIILAQAAITGGAAPLQVVRSFANGKNGDWKNLIVQGDNLQFLKTCYINQDSLIKDKVKGKVKLIYIDPPFTTESDFSGKDGERSYSDKVATAEFIEGLRERLIYLREILADDGSIYLHLDQKMSHYAKIVMDEIFGKDNFINEIIWKRTFSHGDSGQGAKHLGRLHDVILLYKKSNIFTLNSLYTPYSEKYVKDFYKYTDEKGRQYRLVTMTGPGGAAKGNPKYEVMGVTRYWMYSKKRMQELIDNGEVVQTNPGTVPQRIKYLDEGKGVPLQDIWIDIAPVQGVSLENSNYPTQKPEALLERIIRASTRENSNDLILDCFSGSGTTATVAEKLGRRWVCCDFGKHAIYTTQKRILNISDSKKLGNDEKTEKYGQPSKPFCVVSAGAYDFTRIMDLRKNQDAYVSFVLGLFNIVREKNDFSKKYKLPNIYAEKNGDPVEVFPVWDDEYLKNIRIDEEYLQGIIDASGGKLKGDYYIITPETCARIGDTTFKNAAKEKVNFKLLKFPYKVLEELSRHFQIEEQAASSADINRLISSVGFYFNEEIKVEAERKNGGVKITKFNSGILDKNGQRFKGLEGLAMILVDVDYDGKVFDMDVAIYSKDIGEDGVVKVEGLTKDSHIIAIDKHGNESKVIKLK